MQATSCPSCGSQYNTAHMQHGAQFQCSNCGAMVLVQAAAPVQQQPIQQPVQQQPVQQQQAPQQRGGGQVQRRASMPAGGARRAGGAAPRGGARGGAPRGGAQPGFQQQGGYDEGPGRFAPPQKKGNTGLIIGSIVGGMAILVFIIVMATSGGTTMNEADMEVINAITNWQAGQPVPSDETIKKAMEIRTNKNFADATQQALFNRNLSDIETTIGNKDINAFNDTYRAHKEKARKAILDTSNAFITALKNKDKERLRTLIDWSAYHAYLSENGKDQMIQANFPGPRKPFIKDGKQIIYRAPLSHKIEYTITPALKDGKPILKDGKPTDSYKIDSSTLYSLSELQEKGTDYILKMWGTATINAQIHRDEKSGDINVKGTPDIPGAPKSSSKTQLFYGDVNYDNGPGAHYEIANSPLRCFIGGEWGSSSARIVALYDRTLDQWLTRIRDEAFHARNEGHTEGGDTFRPDENGEGEGEGDNSSTSGHPSSPSERWSSSTEVSETGAFMPGGTIKTLFEQAIGDQKSITNDMKNFDAFEALSKAEKIASFGFACDQILSALLFTSDDDKESIVPKIGAFYNDVFNGSALDDVISEEWMDFMRPIRGISPKEYAWRCMKLYEAYKDRK